MLAYRVNAFKGHSYGVSVTRDFAPIDMSLLRSESSHSNTIVSLATPWLTISPGGCKLAPFSTRQRLGASHRVPVVFKQVGFFKEAIHADNT